MVSSPVIHHILVFCAFQRQLERMSTMANRYSDDLGFFQRVLELTVIDFLFYLRLLLQ